MNARATSGPLCSVELGGGTLYKGGPTALLGRVWSGRDFSQTAPGGLLGLIEWREKSEQPCTIEEEELKGSPWRGGWAGRVVFHLKGGYTYSGLDGGVLHYILDVTSGRHLGVSNLCRANTPSYR